MGDGNVIYKNSSRGYGSYRSKIQTEGRGFDSRRDLWVSTFPAAKSGRIADELARSGANVFGWDSEMSMDFETDRKDNNGTVDFEEMINKIEEWGARVPFKIVVLAHDIAFRPGFHF